MRVGAPVKGIDLSGLSPNAAHRRRPAAPTRLPSTPQPTQRAAGEGRVQGVVVSAAGFRVSISRAAVVTDIARPSGAAVSGSLVTGIPPGTWSGTARPPLLTTSRGRIRAHRDDHSGGRRGPLGGSRVRRTRSCRSLCASVTSAHRCGGPPARVMRRSNRRRNSDGFGSDGPGLQAANSASSIWRSILVASAGQEDVTGAWTAPRQIGRRDEQRRSQAGCGARSSRHGASEQSGSARPISR